MLRDAEGKEQICKLSFAWRALGNDLEVAWRHPSMVALLQEKAACKGLEAPPSGCGIRQTSGREQAQVLLGGQNLLRVPFHLWSDHDLRKDLRDHAGCLAIEGPVQCDDTAIGADRVTGQRALVSLTKVVSLCDAAGICVLHDDNGGTLEFAHGFESGVCIVQIIVAQRLALQLLCRSDARSSGAIAIEGCLLMRILAIAKFLNPFGSEGELSPRFCHFFLLFLLCIRHPGGDGCIVGGGMGESLGS